MTVKIVLVLSYFLIYTLAIHDTQEDCSSIKKSKATVGEIRPAECHYGVFDEEGNEIDTEQGEEVIIENVQDEQMILNSFYDNDGIFRRRWVSLGNDRFYCHCNAGDNLKYIAGFEE